MHSPEDVSFADRARPRGALARSVAWPELLILLLTLTIGSLLLWQAYDRRQIDARDRALHVARAHASGLQRNIERMVGLNHSLAALVHRRDGTIANFDEAAELLLQVNPRVVAMSLSPGGVVRHVVPRERNLRLLGFDALNDPAQGGDARFARDTGRLGLAGPMQLTQGGIGFVTRLPVHVDNGVGGQAFWGFANVTMMQSDLIDSTALDDLRGLGYAYELWQLQAESGLRKVIAAFPGQPLERPVRQSLSVPNSAWNLDLAPLSGWRDLPFLAGGGAIVLAGSLFLAFLARTLRAQSQGRSDLAREVGARTAEIDAARNHLRSTLDAIQDPIYEIGLDGMVHDCTAPAGALLPAPLESLPGRLIADLLPDEAAAAVLEALQVAHAQGQSQGEQYSLLIDGERHWFELSVARKAMPQGHEARFVMLTRDVTGRKSAKQEIRRLAFYDPLTDLPNRRLLQDRLEHALAATARSDHLGALMLIDLDNFKALNDTMGHDKGDLLLQQVARRLLGCVRESDTVARLGGDEFVVLIDDAGLNEEDAISRSTTIARKLLEALERPFDISGRVHRSSSSIGVSLFGGRSVSAEEAFKRSDVAMYQAKAAGRNTMRFFDPQMQAAVEARAALEVDLRDAIAQNQLSLHYQPQVGPQGEVVGAEALLRWRHPVRGNVSPAEFIPVAEQSGLVLDIGLWVLRSACAQLAAWARDPRSSTLSLAVNVSVHQFRQTDFVNQVVSSLREVQARPQSLKLEITESMFAVNIEEIIAKMNALKAHGVGFSLDDFGTGYSSLSYLKRLPLDQLKIDQTFVRDVLTDPNDAVIARTIVALGQSLNLSVIAEGVETAGQHAFLLANGCRYCQGYLFSRPLPGPEFDAFLLASAEAAAAGDQLQSG